MCVNEESHVKYTLDFFLPLPHPSEDVEKNVSEWSQSNSGVNVWLYKRQILLTSVSSLDRPACSGSAFPSSSVL